MSAFAKAMEKWTERFRLSVQYLSISRIDNMLHGCPNRLVKPIAKYLIIFLKPDAPICPKRILMCRIVNVYLKLFNIHSYMTSNQSRHGVTSQYVTVETWKYVHACTQKLSTHSCSCFLLRCCSEGSA